MPLSADESVLVTLERLRHWWFDTIALNADWATACARLAGACRREAALGALWRGRRGNRTEVDRSRRVSVSALAPKGGTA